MHCPPETLSSWQGSRGGARALKLMGFSDSKAYRKPVYEGKIGGKIHMLFCNEFLICTIFTGDQLRGSTVVPGVQGFSSWKLVGFSILKAQENPF